MIPMPFIPHRSRDKEYKSNLDLLRILKMKVRPMNVKLVTVRNPHDGKDYEMYLNLEWIKSIYRNKDYCTVYLINEERYEVRSKDLVVYGIIQFKLINEEK